LSGPFLALDATNSLKQSLLTWPALVTAPATRPHNIPSLDGLRAISIAAVLLGHLAGTRGAPHALTAVIRNPYVDFAHLGVRVFFVISGFLITGLLRQEHRRTGTISLSRFYLRRTLRIFPAYYVLLSVLGVLTLAGVIVVPSSDFLHALTYTVNYAPNRVWWIGHLWSLAVEEQFYLLWPTAVVLVGITRSWRVALVVMCVAPLLRVAEAALWPAWQPMVGTTFETTADALAVGCLLALARDDLMKRSSYARAVSSRWIAPALLLLGLAISLRYRPGLLFGDTIVNVAIALIIDRCVRRPEGLAGRVLNTRPLIFVGALSYSLYLWQQLFLNRASNAAANAFPVNILLAVGCALGSYYLVEQPVLTNVRPRVEAWLGRRRQRDADLASPRAWRWPAPTDPREP
jgi:peptidoglycan/LPS O-acetylase OafA/YrhL